MEKLSSTKVAAVLHDAADALRKVASKRDSAVKRASALELQGFCSKLASTMHEKGLHLDKSHDQVAADLFKEASTGKLPIIHQAVDMIGPNMGLSTAHLSDDVTKTAGASDFERFILGGIG
jgi:hypothetical protein